MSINHNIKIINMLPKTDAEPVTDMYANPNHNCIKSLLTYICCFIIYPLFWLTGRSPADAHDPGSLFIQPEVQDILWRVTGFDLDKIFRERPSKDLQPAKYHLLTEKQLQEVGMDLVDWSDMALRT